ncbi:MAG: hypothetical protein R6U63_02515 [Longimicrobiales bacterium]
MMQKEKIFIVGTAGAGESTVDILKEKENAIFIPYSNLFSNNKKIATGANVYFGFPYELWDNVVEVKDVLYGCEDYGDAIRGLVSKLENQLFTRFPGALYVNQPSSIILERDKKLAKKIVQEQGLLVAEELPKDVDTVLNSIYSEEPVYVKARYGSMGKGISYFSEKKWTTNFNYNPKKGTINNHYVDTNWKEIDITGAIDFLKKILEHDVIVEKAILNPTVNGLKFDYRVNSVFGFTHPDLSHARMTDNSSITNMSQGGKYMSFEDIQKIVPLSSLEQALKLIGDASMAAGFNLSGGDVLFKGKDYKPMFLELNSFPGLEISSELDRKVIDKFYHTWTSGFKNERHRKSLQDFLFKPC